MNIIISVFVNNEERPLCSYTCRESVMNSIYFKNLEVKINKLCLTVKPYYGPFVFTDTIKQDLINFCKENGYNCPIISLTKEGYPHIEVDINLLKKGFTFHYFMGLLEDLQNERRTYTKYKQFFINNKKLKLNRAKGNTTIDRVFLKHLHPHSLYNLKEIRRAIKLTI